MASGMPNIQTKSISRSLAGYSFSSFFSGDPSGGALAELTNEVATLKKSSDDMKREIEKLRRDFQNLLQYVQQVSIFLKF